MNPAKFPAPEPATANFAGFILRTPAALHTMSAATNAAVQGNQAQGSRDSPCIAADSGAQSKVSKGNGTDHLAGNMFVMEGHPTDKRSMPEYKKAARRASNL